MERQALDILRNLVARESDRVTEIRSLPFRSGHFSICLLSGSINSNPSLLRIHHIAYNNPVFYIKKDEE